MAERDYAWVLLEYHALRDTERIEAVLQEADDLNRATWAAMAFHNPKGLHSERLSLQLRIAPIPAHLKPTMASAEAALAEIEAKRAAKAESLAAAPADNPPPSEGG